MNNLTLKSYLFLIVILLLTISPAISQVGINTTSPDSNAILDITSSDKGTLLPRINLSSTSSASPLTSHVAGMILYNTATTGDVTPGYYYNNGSQWVRMASVNDDWKLLGNASTNTTTNFLGTTDNVGLRFRTNNTNQLEITNTGLSRYFQNGSAGSPLLSWNGDTNLGIYRLGADNLGISTNGIERFHINNTETVFNDTSNDIDFRVESDGNANALFIDGGLNIMGIGTATPNGILDMTSTTMGMVPPRVSLTSTIVAAPVVNPQGGALAAGTCVYNINTAGTAPNNVAPGLYFWNGSRWVAFAGSPGGLDWTLTGNSGTNTTSNFLGTTDNVGVIFRSNNTERMEIENDGQVNIGMGATASTADRQFEVLATTTNGTAITGYGTGTGYGVRAYNRTADTGAGPALLAYTDNYTANMLALNANATTGNGIISAGNNNSLYSYTGSGAGGSFTGTTIGTTGIAMGSTGTGVTGTGNGRSTSVTDTRGSGVAGSGDYLGIYAYAGNGARISANEGNSAGRFSLDSDNDVTTTTGSNADRAAAILAGYDDLGFTDDGGSTYSNERSYFGGYFSGGNQDSGTSSYAYVGLRYDTNADGTTGTDFKIVGPGSNSTLIQGPNGEPRIMFSPEAPEILFQDFGVGQLVNGHARINLDPLLISALYVDDQHPLKVYVTLEGECNGIYVTNKSVDGFDVKELQGGTSNVPFSWQIVANRADTKDRNGNVVSKNVGLRLPIGPSQLKNRPVKLDKVEETKIDQNSTTTAKQ